MSSVKDKVALVTGAAMGIERACAEMLAAEGAAVALSDVNMAAGKDATGAIEKAKTGNIFVIDDGTDVAFHARLTTRFCESNPSARSEPRNVRTSTRSQFRTCSPADLGRCGATYMVR
jgi:NAD(P)-dependent dehydrogenase (short-subunit alcohol dehydrogenase family)